MIGTTTALLLAGGLGVGGNLLSSLIGSRAAQQAAEAQSRAAQHGEEVANTQAGYIYDTAMSIKENILDAGKDAQGKLSEAYGEGRKALSPYIQAGETSLGGLLNLAQKGLSAQDVYADPGYQFRLQEGEKALQRSAAAKGGVLGGAAMKALARYSQGLASQEYQNAFNRQYGLLSTLTGLGRSAASEEADLARWYGSTSAASKMDTAVKAGQFAMGGTSEAANMRLRGAEYGIEGANARAAGTVGSGNAWAAGIGGAANSIADALILAKLLD